MIAIKAIMFPTFGVQVGTSLPPERSQPSQICALGRHVWGGDPGHFAMWVLRRMSDFGLCISGVA